MKVMRPICCVSLLLLEREREHSSLKTPRGKGGKLVREMKGLVSSINYDRKADSSKWGQSEGRALMVLR